MFNKKIMKRWVTGFLMIGMLMTSMTGCGSMKVEYIEIKPNETAILVPYEGDTTQQKVFRSEEFYKKNLVPSKRVKITYSKKRIGLVRFEKKPDSELLRVDRTPVNREWTSASNTGTSYKNQGFVVESSGSIGFVVPLTCTAQIQEIDAPKFLYEYPNSSLAIVMDTEVRNHINTKFVEEMSKYTVEEARVKKSDIINAVRESTIAHFAKKGITITNLGFAGQYTYIDPEIQKSINAVFTAEKKRQQAIIDKETAKEEAEALQIRKETMAEQIKLKEKENEAAWIDKWDGHLPKVMSGDSGMLLQLPAED